VTDRLLDAAEVAAMLNVPVSWVRQETLAGRIPFVPLGRHRRYDRAKVLEWVESLSSNGSAGAVCGSRRTGCNRGTGSDTRR
jgi:excisionase family DNA binding protein